MKLRLMIATTVVAASAASIASAAQVSPVSYSFDQSTSCGSFCYNDTATPSKLTDGLVGVAGWATNGGTEWDGWNSKPLVNIDFNFGTAKSISSVTIGSTQDSLGDVVLPSYDIFSSSNGSNWILVQSLIVPPSSANDNSPFSTAPHGFFTLSGLGINSQYVRVAAIANGPWTFIDEVSFQGGTVPEPAAWALMVVGFGLVGAAARRRPAVLTA